MSQMTAHIELFHGRDCGVIRVFEGGKTFGEEYCWACTIRLDGDAVELLGVDKPPTFEQVSAMRDAALKLGCKWAIWERIKGGKLRKVKVKLSRI